MSKEFEREKIPVAIITAMAPLAHLVGAHRIIAGVSIPNPCGNPAGVGREMSGRGRTKRGKKFDLELGRVYRDRRDADYLVRIESRPHPRHPPLWSPSRWSKSTISMRRTPLR